MLQWVRKVRLFQLVFVALALSLLELNPALAEPARFSQLRLHLHSAVRFPGETFNQAFVRYQKRIAQFGGHRLPIRNGEDQNVTVSQAAGPFEVLPHERVPVWHYDGGKVAQAFKAIRDPRFIKDNERPSFPRRPTWMYPDDGCFARAALMVNRLEGMKVAAPAKIFIFGDLNVKTINSPSGQVGWWYHVAPIVRVGQQEFVLDPAINPDHVLPINEWIRAMRPEGNLNGIKFAICSSHSYVPSDICMAAEKSDGRAMIDQQAFLPLEWDRLIELKRDPKRELGEYPPWLAFRPLFRFN